MIPTLGRRKIDKRQVQREVTEVYVLFLVEPKRIVTFHKYLNCSRVIPTNLKATTTSSSHPSSSPIQNGYLLTHDLLRDLTQVKGHNPRESNDDQLIKRKYNLCTILPKLRMMTLYNELCSIVEIVSVFPLFTDGS